MVGRTASVIFLTPCKGPLGTVGAMLRTKFPIKNGTLIQLTLKQIRKKTN